MSECCGTATKLIYVCSGSADALAAANAKKQGPFCSAP